MTALRIAGAVLVLLWSLAGAGYAVMAFTPFTKIQFLDSHVIPATATLARWHGTLAWMALGGALLALSSGVSRLTLWIAGVAGAAAAAALTLWPVLPGLDSEPRTLVWCAAFLVPSIALSLVLLRKGDAPAAHHPDAPHAVALAALLAALVCWASGLAVAAQRMPLADMGVRPGMALAAHVVLFVAAAAVHILILFVCVNRTARRLVMLVLGGALATAVAYTWVFRAMNITGPDALAIASLFGLTLALGFPRVGLRSVPVAAVLLLAVGAATVVLQPIIAPLDWNFLGQRTAMILAWVAAFALARPIAARMSARAWIVPAVCVLALALTGALRVAQAYVDPSRVAAWAAVDPAFAAIGDLAPQHRSGADEALFTFLQEHTGLPRASVIAPYDVTFTASLTPRVASPPNVFIFVVDSLRQDYLGAYDPSVTFTPSLDRFAADSLVFTRAFTRYGATGLAQPSLWVGGIMPHKQYIQPFAPMNALEKLVRANAYDVRLSYDIISHQILMPSTPRVDLDAGVQNMDYRLCSTLITLTAGLAERNGRPVFAYSMPQDVHVSTLSREGNAAIDGEDYGGKFAPYASRVRRLDACFGTFVESLRAMDLYNESIIIVTADHGDSLGEGGRWGHAYTVFPEILRVPLLIKLPWSVQGLWESRVDDVAFTTDVTPTLYRLLGYDVRSDDRFFGVPLVSTARQTRARSPRQLAASSYGPVYAVIDDNGQSLYILDAVNYRDHLFRLGASASGDREVAPNPTEQAEYQTFIRTRLGELHALYGITRPVSPPAVR